MGTAALALLGRSEYTLYIKRKPAFLGLDDMQMVAWFGAALGARQPTDQLSASQTFVLAPRPLRIGSGPLPLTPQCADTPGWSAHGVSCRNFESWGVCKDNTITQQYGSFKQWSWQFDYPDRNCCACGKLQSAFQRETVSLPKVSLSDQEAGITPPKVVRKLADSTFCWMVYKVGVEDEVVEYMYTNGIGVFACDSHAVFSFFDISDLHEATCMYGGNKTNGCNVAADGPAAMPLLLKGASMDRLSMEEAAPWEEIRGERQKRQTQRQAAKEKDLLSDYSNQLVRDEEEKYSKPISDSAEQMAAETERRRDAVDVEVKKMVVRRAEAVDAEAKKAEEAKEAYQEMVDTEANKAKEAKGAKEAKSLMIGPGMVKDQQEKSRIRAEADARRIEEENEKQIAAVDAEIKKIAEAGAAYEPVRTSSTKAEEAAVEAEIKHIAEERNRKSADAGAKQTAAEWVAAHPGSEKDGQETERQLDLVNAVKMKLAEAQEAQEAQALNEENPTDTGWTSLAKVAHPTDSYRFKGRPTTLRATRVTIFPTRCPKPATWCAYEGATNEPRECDEVPGHFCHDVYGKSGFWPCDESIEATWGHFECVGARLICPEARYVASSLEATDGWCEDSCKAYGCSTEDAKRVCKCPEAASEAADEQEGVGVKKLVADDTNDDQDKENRQTAEDDARKVEQANEKQRAVVEAEKKKILDANKLQCPEAYVAISTEATDDWCANACADGGCPADDGSQDVCECGVKVDYQDQAEKNAKQAEDDARKVEQANQEQRAVVQHGQSARPWH